MNEQEMIEALADRIEVVVTDAQLLAEPFMPGDRRRSVALMAAAREVLRQMRFAYAQGYGVAKEAYLSAESDYEGDPDSSHVEGIAPPDWTG